VRKTGFQPFHRLAPFRGKRLANRILVPEEADLVHRVVLVNRIEPLHRDEVLTVLGILPGGVLRGELRT
jgi:hypothetical protein